VVDDSFCCLRSLFFGAKKKEKKEERMNFPKEPWMPECSLGVASLPLKR